MTQSRYGILYTSLCISLQREKNSFTTYARSSSEIIYFFLITLVLFPYNLPLVYVSQPKEKPPLLKTQNIQIITELEGFDIASVRKLHGRNCIAPELSPRMDYFSLSSLISFEESELSSSFSGDSVFPFLVP